VHTMVTHSTRSPPARKATRVDLGRACLAQGEWPMILALTLLLWKEALRQA